MILLLRLKLKHVTISYVIDREKRRKRIDVRLGGGTDTRDGKTDVDSGTDTTEEEFGLQEDLTIGNGNDLEKIPQNP